MQLDSVSVHEHAKNELGQYPAILTSRLVNNPYIHVLLGTATSKLYVNCTKNTKTLKDALPHLSTEFLGFNALQRKFPGTNTFNRTTVPLRNKRTETYAKYANAHTRIRVYKVCAYTH